MDALFGLTYILSLMILASIVFNKISPILLNKTCRKVDLNNLDITKVLMPNVYFKFCLFVFIYGIDDHLCKDRSLKNLLVVPI